MDHFRSTSRTTNIGGYIMEIKEFKIRCSTIGQIMTNDRSGKDMGKTTKTYCELWLKEQIYGRKKEFTSKHTQKGLIVEDNSIDFIAERLNLGMLFKNEEHFGNDYMEGTPDIILPDQIIDAKNSWDCFTFPLFEDGIPTDSYEWQLQGYMELTNKDKATLAYVLSDTPINLIEKEAYYWCKNNGYEELDLDVYKEFMKRMTYGDIDPKFKLKTYEVIRDKNKAEQIKARVYQCRDYIETLKLKLNVTVHS